MRYAIGLDNGGTVIKAAVYDEHGKELAVSQRKTEVISPQLGYNERDMGDLWQANIDCIREVVEKSGIPSNEIIGIAVGGHGKGLYLVDKMGKPLYNGIMSTDSRAISYSVQWEKDGVAQKVYSEIYQKILPSQPVALLAWLKDNMPDIYNNIGHVFSVKDYIRYGLTGIAYSEATDISGSGLISLKEKKKSKELLEVFGISEVYDAIPEIKYSYEYCGEITKKISEQTGLLEGTPVAGGMFDIDSCAVAMAITEPEQLCTITGTWSINEFISKEPVLNTPVAMNSLFATEGYYLIEDSSPTSAGNLEWVIKNLLPAKAVRENELAYEAVDRLVAETLPQDAKIYFLPFLYGSNQNIHARSCFVGMTSHDDYSQLLRAVFEGVAYSHKTHIDKLLTVREKPKAIRLAGGAANSKVWVQMFADILNIPIETVNSVKELGALGCAMAAFVSAGVYKDYIEAGKHMVKIDKVVCPNLELVNIYEEKYQSYSLLCNALNPIWSQI